jgi:hypothetical protein
MAQVVQNLPSKFKDLSSNPSTTKGREKEKKKNPQKPDEVIRRINSLQFTKHGT